MSDRKNFEYLQQVESHAAETGWVAPLTQEDREYFAHLRKVFERYNVKPSQASAQEYAFAVGIAEEEFCMSRLTEKRNSAVAKKLSADQALQCLRGTFAAEGMDCSAETIAALQRVANGEISLEECLQSAIEHQRREISAKQKETASSRD